MPRARSGSFYCPLEPALPPLSIAQKAAISTAPVPSSVPSKPSPPSPSLHLRRHIRSPSFDGADGPASVTFPAARLETTTLGTQPLLLKGRNVGNNTPYTPKRYPWTPFKPSPLRRQTNAAAPMCASALWTTHPELLPLYQSSQPNAATTMSSGVHKSRPRTQPSLRQSVTRHAFMSGPMGEKTHMYGLRVAWCVFGDVKEALAKDIFVRGTRPGYYHQQEEQRHHTEHVEVVQSDALSPPPPPRSRLRRERSFVWDVQGPLITPGQLLSEQDPIVAPDLDAVEHFDTLSDTDSESEYSDDGDTDTETESVESDDLDLDSDLDLSLDDEEEVHRDIMALLSSAGIMDRNSDKASDGNAHWDMMSFEL